MKGGGHLHVMPGQKVAVYNHPSVQNFREASRGSWVGTIFPRDHQTNGPEYTVDRDTQCLVTSGMKSAFHSSGAYLLRTSAVMSVLYLYFGGGVLGIEPRPAGLPGTCSTTRLPPQPLHLRSLNRFLFPRKSVYRECSGRVVLSSGGR